LKSKIRIVPSVLTDNPETLKDMLYRSETFTDFVQIDIMDGRFVPSKSITLKDIAGVKTGLKWEAHLMVKNPENYIEGFAKAGAQQIIFHYEATETPESLISIIKNPGVKAGIAVNPETPISVLFPLIDKIDSVLFMSVIPGFYGSKFIPEVLGKITEFHSLYPQIQTGIDGGVKEANISLVAKTGVNSICVGSAVFCQENMAESYRRLEKIGNESLR
jgi:ribulose-phosphate 3-epimerase